MTWTMSMAVHQLKYSYASVNDMNTVRDMYIWNAVMDKILIAV